MAVEPLGSLPCSQTCRLAVCSTDRRGFTELKLRTKLVKAPPRYVANVRVCPSAVIFQILSLLVCVRFPRRVGQSRIQEMERRRQTNESHVPRAEAYTRKLCLHVCERVMEREVTAL